MHYLKYILIIIQLEQVIANLEENLEKKRKELDEFLAKYTKPAGKK